MNESKKGDDVQNKNINDAKTSPNKWADLGTRLISSFIIIFIQIIIFLAGSKYLIIEFIILQYIAFREFCNLHIQINIERQLNFFVRYYPYILLTIIDYYFSSGYISSIFSSSSFIIEYHSLICYLLLCVSLVLFIIGIRSETLSYSYLKLGWGIIGIILIGIPAYFMSQISLTSFAWIFMSIANIVWNDSAAYFFGRLFGKTQLISLSPKKTVEGFVGALVFVPILCFFFPILFSYLPYLYCHQPTPFDFQSDCSIPYEYIKKSFSIFGKSFLIYPIQIHSFILALFGSIIAPFGGFLASGFKRSLNIKDFSNIIPGHGGIIDRIDCMLVMGAFSYLYLKSVVHLSF